MIKKWVLLLFIAAFLSSCNSEPAKEKLIVSVAASCQFAFKEIAKEFTAKTSFEVDIISSSSGKITTQILNGAPYDIFASANLKYVEVIYNKGKAESKPIIYGYGVPVIWTFDTTFNPDSLAQYIDRADINNIAVAEKKNAPYGQMAISFLKKENLYQKILPKLVYGESISQVNEYIFNKTVQLGFTAKSTVSAPILKGKGKVWELPQAYHIEQGIVMVKNKTSKELKQDFLNFVLSEEGKIILKKYGYGII